jgi:hypothetical protein
MKIKKNFILREIAGTYLVVAVGEAVKNFNAVINLNETGAFMWKFFTEEHSLEEAVDALCAEYDVERERAAVDVEKFANILIHNGFVE